MLRRILATIIFAVLILGGATGSVGASAEVRTSMAKEGLRAVWVSSVYNLDYPQRPTTDAAALKREADRVLSNAAELGMNAVFLQVRPSCDALYPSALYPWSAWLTGTQGTAPTGGFDPLEYWVEGAHALGLELHAWINPYRVTKKGAEEFALLSPNNPAVIHPGWVVKHDKDYYLNPGLPEVREYVIQGAEEIVQKYNVDGIHLDDYFYPGKDFQDDAAFQQYGGGRDRDNWRRENVNLLIRTLDARLHALKPGFSFGVSPSGVWRDKKSDPLGSDTTGGYESYSHAYADSRKWVKEGMVDYICPQIYWPIGHKTMDYATVARWWADTVRGTGVKLYIGMADYQADKKDPASPWYGSRAIRDQLTLNRTLSEVAGEAHFRYRLVDGSLALRNLYLEEYAGVDTGLNEEMRLWLSRLPEAEGRHWAAKYYGKLGIMGVVTGYPDGTYRPEDSVSRGELCKLAFGAMPQLNGAYLVAGVDGNPVPDTAGAWSEPYLVPLFHAGYLDAAAYPDGFGAGEPMTRAEVAGLLVRALGYRDDGSITETRFPDVTRDFYSIAKAAELGIVTGNEDGTFAPDAPITRATAAVMILRAMKSGK